MHIKKITFCGHSACFFEGDNYIVAIDPWLKGNPACPESLQNPKQIDLIVLTHGHFDHAGDTVRLANLTGAKVIANYELSSILVKEGLNPDQSIGMNKGGTTALNGLHVSLSHAIHSSSYDLPSGTVYAGEPCGVVLRDSKRAIYHSGDTALFSDMELIGEFYAPEIALLPIGDVYTMNPREAARAAKFVGCKVAIPIHFDTFPVLTGTAEEFGSECSKYGVRAVALSPGESFAIQG